MTERRQVVGAPSYGVENFSKSKSFDGIFERHVISI